MAQSHSLESQNFQGNPQLIQNPNGLISMYPNQNINDLSQMGFGQLNQPQFLLGSRQLAQSQYQQDFNLSSQGNQSILMNQLFQQKNLKQRSGPQIQDPHNQYYISPQAIIQMGAQKQIHDIYQNPQAQLGMHPFGGNQFMGQPIGKNIPSHQQYGGIQQFEPQVDMRLNQNLINPNRKYSNHIHESSEMEKKNERIEEFDSDFLFNNPGIIKTQKFLRDNSAHFIEVNQIEDFQFQEEIKNDSEKLNIHVNLATNNSKQSINFGLNQNKRGKMKEADVHKFLNQLNTTSSSKEQIMNSEFMAESSQLIQEQAQARCVQQIQFSQRQASQTLAIQQQIQKIELQTQQIHHRQALIQQSFLQIEEQEKQQLQKKGQNKIQPEDKSQDLKSAKQQLKEELKQELREQIRQELIESFPIEARKQLKEQKKDAQSNNAKRNQQQPSCFQKASSDQVIKEDSGNSSSKKAQSSENRNFIQYKFGLIDQPKSISHSSKKVQKKSSSGSEDSEEKEDRLLKQSYDEYGKMITENNHMKSKIKSPLLEIDEDLENINQMLDEESKQNSSVHNQSIGQRKSIKNSRSSSVGKDQLAQQLLHVKQQNGGSKLTYQRDRVNSIQYGKSNQPQSYGSEGGQKFLRKHNKHIQLNDNLNEKDDVFDILEFQMEDERLKILNEIQIIVQQQRRPGNSNYKKIENEQVPLKELNQGLRGICENLKSLMIEFDTSKIIQLQYKERKILRELIHSYKDVLINKSNFKNIENLENESKSDDEFSDDLQSDSPKQNKVGPQNKKYNKKAGNTSKFKAYNKDAQRDFKFSVQNMENDQCDDRFIGNSVVSRGSKRYKSNNNILRNDTISDSSSEQIENSEDQDSSEEQVQPVQNLSSPSLQEIYRSPSYKSIDSKVKKQNARKFDPNVMKIRGDILSRRDSLKSAQSSQAKSKKFLQDVISQGSVAQSKKSLYRRDKLQGLEIDYHEYLQRSQGIFIIRCQMMNIELSQIREKYDLEKLMLEFKNFKKLQKETQQDEVYRSLQTVVIDIENTLVTQIDIRNKQELDSIKNSDHFENDYIIMKKQQKARSKKDKDKSIFNLKDEICCEFKDTENCICDVLVYQVRPYTYDFLRAIQPFFEIVVFSRLHHRELEFIIDHIESVLNKPIKDFLEKFSNNRQKSSFQRMKKLPDIKIYFQFIIHQRQYIHIKEHDKYIENLMVLTKNRSKENLIFISSNPFRIVTAIKYGFLTIPVIQFESFYRDDFQLSLVENYILKIRHLKDMKKRLKQDFKMLVQRIERDSRRPSISSQSVSKSAQRRKSNEQKLAERNSQEHGSKKHHGREIFEAASQGSFGGKKLMDRIQQKEQIMKSKESNSSDYDIEEINKQIASPKISYEPIKAKPTYERGRKSSFGNLNQNQFGDQDSDESSELQEEKKLEQPIQEENSQEQDESAKSKHDSIRSINKDKIQDQPQNVPFGQQINNENSNLKMDKSHSQFGMNSSPSFHSQQQLPKEDQNNKKLQQQQNYTNFRIEVSQQQPSVIIEEQKEKTFQDLLQLNKEHLKLSKFQKVETMKKHNTNKPLSDKNILALDRQINCQLKKNNNSIGDESMLGNLSIQNHQGNIIVNVGSGSSHSPPNSKDVSNSGEGSSEKVATVSSGQNIVKRKDKSNQSLSNGSGNPSDQDSSKQDSKDDSKKDNCSQSIKSQSSSGRISIVQGRVVYDAGSIILEESKDMSDLSANNSVTANNASFSKKASFLSGKVSKSSNNGSSHEVEEQQIRQPNQRSSQNSLSQANQDQIHFEEEKLNLDKPELISDPDQEKKPHNTK